jgi:hypothetical protein
VDAVGSWQETYDLLSGEDRPGALSGDDLDRLAASAYLVGREEESVKAWERAHAKHAAGGDAARAARSAFWLAFTLMNRGEHARAGGWFARVQRILAEHGGDCPERGYLLGMAGMERMAQGDPSEALALFRRSAEVSRRFDDIDGAAAAPILGPPQGVAPGQPGPLGLADPERTRKILEGVGFTELTVEDVTVPMRIGADVDDPCVHLLDPLRAGVARRRAAVSTGAGHHRRPTRARGACGPPRSDHTQQWRVAGHARNGQHGL